MLNTLRFLHEFARNPSRTGAVAPSSRALAKAMVAALGTPAPDAVIVELGPGTGSFTTALQRLLPQQHHVAIERNQRFADILRRKVPEAEVVEGCATEIPAILDRLGLARERVHGIISGLPLLAFDDELRAAIFASAGAVLGEGRTLINFTYSQRCFRRMDTPGFTTVSCRRVLMNMPPANVMVLQRSATPMPTAIG